MDREHRALALHREELRDAPADGGFRGLELGVHRVDAAGLHPGEEVPDRVRQHE